MHLSRELTTAVLCLISAGAFAADKAPNAAMVKRGGYLVRFAGCSDCHTPWTFNKDLGAPVPDESRFLSGHPEGAPDPAGKYAAHDMAVIGPTFTSFAVPFGVVYSANLTPDKDTGIGSWTEAMFIKTLRNGRHMGGEKSARPIYPPMPWQTIRLASDEDLKAIFAFLRTIPAIRNAVPDPKVPPEVAKQFAAGVEKAEKMMMEAAKNAPKK